MNVKKDTERGRKRILVVDDHPILREGLLQSINRESDLMVCGEAENAHQALVAISKLKPDLVLVDIGLPGKSGFELVKDVRTVHPEVPVLVLSMHDESLYAERVLRAGARGYVMKHEPPGKLIEAIRTVLSGKAYVSEKMEARILDVFSGRRPKGSSVPLERLTDREFEILELIGRGKSSREVAKALHLSVKTIEVHRANIKTKLKLKSGPELIRFAVRWAESQGAGS